MYMSLVSRLWPACMLIGCMCLFTSFCPRVGPVQSHCPFTFPPSTLSFSIVYFSPFLFLTRFIYFLAFSSFHILPE